VRCYAAVWHLLYCSLGYKLFFRWQKEKETVLYDAKKCFLVYTLFFPARRKSGDPLLVLTVLYISPSNDILFARWKRAIRQM
jgi:hypothetical protein